MSLDTVGGSSSFVSFAHHCLDFSAKAVSLDTVSTLPLLVRPLPAALIMSSKEVFCTISQFIYDDLLDSFEAKGIFAQLHGLP